MIWLRKALSIGLFKLTLKNFDLKQFTIYSREKKLNVFALQELELNCHVAYFTHNPRGTLLIPGVNKKRMVQKKSKSGFSQ